MAQPEIHYQDEETGLLFHFTPETQENDAPTLSDEALKRYALIIEAALQTGSKTKEYFYISLNEDGDSYFINPLTENTPNTEPVAIGKWMTTFEDDGVIPLSIYTKFQTAEKDSIHKLLLLPQGEDIQIQVSRVMSESEIDGMSIAEELQGLTVFNMPLEGEAPVAIGEPA
jgi:hypothetical protein